MDPERENLFYIHKINIIADTSKQDIAFSAETHDASVSSTHCVLKCVPLYVFANTYQKEYILEYL